MADYVNCLDSEQNERIQQEEQEISRLWKARSIALTELEYPKKSILTRLDDNKSISEVESHYDETESVISQQTTYSEVKLKQ